MSDTITFELPANEYNTNIAYDKHRNLYVESTSIITDNINIADLKAVAHKQNDLLFPYCGKSYNDVSMNKIEIKDNTTKMELQIKDRVLSEVIKNSAKSCGFKVK